MNIGEVLSEMREMSEINSNFRIANNWADAIEAAMQQKDTEIERLQRACASAEAWIVDSGTISNGEMDILQELRAALAGKQP